MRRGICGSYLNDLGLLSNFKSVRVRIIYLKAILNLFFIAWNYVYCIKNS